MVLSRACWGGGSCPEPPGRPFPVFPAFVLARPRSAGGPLRLRSDHNGDEMDGSFNSPFGSFADEAFMDTARMRCLRLMEQTSEVEELIDLLGREQAAHLPMADMMSSMQTLRTALDSPLVSPTDTSKLAMQEEWRRIREALTESCAQNWREQPLCDRATGYVPGNRKVQQVKLGGSNVMFGSDTGFVGVSHIPSGRDLFRQHSHSALVTALDWDSSTGWLISAADDGMVVVYRDTEQGIICVSRHHLHSNRVVAAEILDHRYGMTASVDSKIFIFELESGRIVREIHASDTLLGVSVCKGYVFVGLMNGACEAYSIHSGRLAFRYVAQRSSIRSVQTFMTTNSIKVVLGGQDGNIRQFQVRSVMSTQHWKIPHDRSLDDRLVLICNTHVDHETREADQGMLFPKVHMAPVVAVACDDEKVISASEDGVVVVWSAGGTTNAAPVQQIWKHIQGGLISSVDFNEQYLVTDGTRGQVVAFDYSVSPPPRRAPRRSSRGRGGGAGTGRRTRGPSKRGGGGSTATPAGEAGGPPDPSDNSGEGPDKDEGGSEGGGWGWGRIP